MKLLRLMMSYGAITVMLLVLAEDNSLSFDTTPIPFEITSEIKSLTPTRISAPFTGADVAASTGYFEVRLARDGTIEKSEIALFDGDYNTLALDVLRPSLRQNLVFSHENTVRSSVMFAHHFLTPLREDLPDDTWTRIYNAVDEHPSFTELVNLLRTTGHVPDDPLPNGYHEVAYAISVDLVEEFLDEDGQSKI